MRLAFPHDNFDRTHSIAIHAATLDAGQNKKRQPGFECTQKSSIPTLVLLDVHVDNLFQSGTLISQGKEAARALTDVQTSNWSINGNYCLLGPHYYIMYRIFYMFTKAYENHISYSANLGMSAIVS